MSATCVHADDVEHACPLALAQHQSPVGQRVGIDPVPQVAPGPVAPELLPLLLLPLLLVLEPLVLPLLVLEPLPLPVLAPLLEPLPLPVLEPVPLTPLLLEPVPLLLPPAPASPPLDEPLLHDVVATSTACSRTPRTICRDPTRYAAFMRPAR